MEIHAWEFSMHESEVELNDFSIIGHTFSFHIFISKFSFLLYFYI
jgi:hypothetical protein